MVEKSSALILLLQIWVFLWDKFVRTILVSLPHLENLLMNILKSKKWNIESVQYNTGLDHNLGVLKGVFSFLFGFVLGPGAITGMWPKP